MADFPYTQVPGKLKSFLDKIPHIGIPDKADKKWLSSIGFVGRDDYTILGVLQFIGFLDQSGKPTQHWIAYRDKTRSGRVLAEGVVEGYAELFQTYSDAHRRDDNDLKAFLSTRTTAGARIVYKKLVTFKALCKLAEFGDAVAEQVETPPLIHEPAVDLGTVATKSVPGLGTGFTLNINIQLTLPDTTDETVYDKLFDAMKRHLLS